MSSVQCHTKQVLRTKRHWWITSQGTSKRVRTSNVRPVPVRKEIMHSFLDFENHCFCPLLCCKPCQKQDPGGGPGLYQSKSEDRTFGREPLVSFSGSIVCMKWIPTSYPRLTDPVRLHSPVTRSSKNVSLCGSLAPGYNAKPVKAVEKEGGPAFQLVCGCPWRFYLQLLAHKSAEANEIAQNIYFIKCHNFA